MPTIWEAGHNENANACGVQGSAHPDLSADRPPFHTPGGTTGLISINREKVGGGVMILMRRDTLDSLRNKNKEPFWPWMQHFLEQDSKQMFHERFV